MQGKANPNLKTRGGTTALMAAATKGYHKIVQVMLDHGCDMNLGNSMGATALHLAAMTEQPRCIELLLEHGADASVRVHSGVLEGRRAREVAQEEATIKVFKKHRKGIAKYLGVDM